jgi:hypothetical protein
MRRTSASSGFCSYAASAFLQASSKKNIRSASLIAPISMAAGGGFRSPAAGSDSGVRVLGSPPSLSASPDTCRLDLGGGPERWGGGGDVAS